VKCCAVAVSEAVLRHFLSPPAVLHADRTAELHFKGCCC